LCAHVGLVSSPLTLMRPRERQRRRQARKGDE
jgi:hypothetical protein